MAYAHTLKGGGLQTITRWEHIVDTCTAELQSYEPIPVAQLLLPATSPELQRVPRDLGSTRDRVSPKADMVCITFLDERAVFQMGGTMVLRCVLG